MIKIKDLFIAKEGDFIYYDHHLSVISSVDKVDGKVIIKLTDGTELQDNSIRRAEIFRTIDNV